MREEEQVTAQSTQAAHHEAQKDDPMGDMEPTDFLSILQDPDIESPEFEEIEDVLQPHLSGTNVTTYYDEDDRQKIELSNLALAKRVISERDRGRLCTGPFLEIAQGAHRRPDKPVKDRWTDEERRAVRAALIDVRTAMQFLGIDHVGLSKTADTTVETRVQRIDDDNSKGRLKKAQEKVFG